MGRPSYLTSSFCVKRSGDDDWRSVVKGYVLRRDGGGS
jgi:hypothetical protein